MHCWYLNNELSPLTIISLGCLDRSSMHFDNSFAQVESHTEPSRNPTPSHIFIKKFLYINSIESRTIIFNAYSQYSFDN